MRAVHAFADDSLARRPCTPELCRQAGWTLLPPPDSEAQMRKLHLNTEDLHVESFATTDTELPRRGTVHAKGGTFSNGGLESCGAGGCVGYSSGSVICACDTTHTQQAPECDPSAQTLCVGNTLCE
jgi:hypothetical protein